MTPDQLRALLQDEDDGKMVDLVSQEGDNFQVEKKVAKMSELVKTMIPGRMKKVLNGFSTEEALERTSCIHAIVPRPLFLRCFV
jgi:hypothetical protein